MGLSLPHYLKNEMESNTKNIYKFKKYIFEKVHPFKPSKHPAPSARSGHRIVCDDKNLYLYGGYCAIGSDENLYFEIWRFNFATRIWKRYPYTMFPEEVASAAILYDGRTLLAHGGTGIPFGRVTTNNIYMFNLNNPTEFENLKLAEPRGEEPDPMYGQAIVYHNQSLYTYGGTTGFLYSSDIHRLDLKERKWYLIEPRNIRRHQFRPEERYRHEVILCDSKIFVFGGGNGEKVFDFREIPVFDLDTFVWELIKSNSNDCPPKRMCHGCASYKSENNKLNVYIIGGCESTKIHNDFWRLDMETMNWTIISNKALKTPVCFHSACINPQGKMYVFGGLYNNRRHNGQQRVERTDSLFSAWIHIPKLSEMCWEAVLFYIPKIKYEQKSSLLKLGIPINFVERLQEELI